MIGPTTSHDEFNINDLDVFFLDSRALIFDACALLYKTCIEVTHPWKFDPDNPSQIHVESRHGKHVLVDTFTDSADWLGVFDGDKMVACGRLITPEKSPTGKLECESYPGARIVELPRGNSIEMNRVAVMREYQGSKIHNLIYLAAFDHCRLQKKSWVGCTSHPSIRRLFQKISFKPLLAKAFKYAETDPESVDVFCADPVKLKVYCKNLRDTLAPQQNILDALEMIAPVVPTPLYWHDMEGRVLGLNDATLEIMGAPDRAAIIGKSPFDFYPEDTAMMIWSHSAEVIRTGQVLSQDEPINQIATGEYVYAKAIKAPLCDGNGKIIGIIGTSVDITAEKLAAQFASQSVSTCLVQSAD